MNMLASIVEEIKRDSSGAEVIKDWLGSGGVPVSPDLAEFRASVCASGYLGQKCPNNVEPNWWDRVKHAVAEMIKKHLAVKNNLGLHVSRESELSMCKCCGCCLPLKIWVPIEHVSNHTSTETMISFPNFCWQKKELLKKTGDI